jgi:hypothetical protein
MYTKGSSGARSATSNGGGRGGASSFPARGRRTQGNKARTSSGEVRGCFPPLKLDRDRPERGDRRRGGARFSPEVMAVGILRVWVMEGGGGGAG